MKNKLTAKMKYGIAGADVREKGVTESLTFRGALNKSGDVNNVQEPRYLTEIVKINIMIEKSEAV